MHFILTFTEKCSFVPSIWKASLTLFSQIYAFLSKSLTKIKKCVKLEENSLYAILYNDWKISQIVV